MGEMRDWFIKFINNKVYFQVMLCSKNIQFMIMSQFSRIILFPKLDKTFELKFQNGEHKLSAISVINLGLQMFEAIRHFHDLGVIHRAIKLANFIMGFGKKSK